MKMKEMSNTMVNLRTQEEYDEYMQMCEDAHWNWCTGNEPKTDNVWENLKDQTCIYINDFFSYCSLRFAEERGCTILTLVGLKEKLRGQNEEIFTTEFYNPISDTHEIQRIDFPNNELEIKSMHFDECNELEELTNNKMNIKETIKRIKLTKPEKTFVEAGLMTTDKEWTHEAKEYARDKILEEYMNKKEFKDDVLVYAEEVTKKD